MCQGHVLQKQAVKLFLKFDFFFFLANTTCDGDKESEVEDVETDSGNSPEDLRKVS